MVFLVDSEYVDSQPPDSDDTDVWRDRAPLFPSANQNVDDAAAEE